MNTTLLGRRSGSGLFVAAITVLAGVTLFAGCSTLSSMTPSGRKVEAKRVANSSSCRRGTCNSPTSTSAVSSRQKTSPGHRSPIERYSFETVELLKDRVEIVKWRRDLLVAQARLAGATEEEAEKSIWKITLQVIDVSFDAISDPKERAYFMNLPTSFVLPPEDIDRLREVAGQLLRQSAEYETIVHELGGSPGE